MITNFESIRDVNPQVVGAFLGLQLSGMIGFAVVVSTATCSQNVKRKPTWYAFCAAWILSCLSYTLVFLVGQQDAPNYGVCVTQAAAIYASPGMAGCSTLALSIDMLLGVRASQTMSVRRRYGVTLTLMITPYVLWLGLFIGFLVYGLQNPATVKMGPNGTYCDLSTVTPSRISGMIVVLSMLPLIVIQGYIGSRLVRNRNFLRDFKLVQMATRVMIFSLLGVLGMGVGFAYVIFSEQGPVFDIILAALPASGVLIFGTQMDLVNVWLFRHPTQEEDHDSIDKVTPA
ncbi:hypothetical protein FB45DRAFT_902552 [Roridomyces roridus]|uniref:Uncharacterized protein n=1 Tax=Roridomyces roridus TaxID=1738132 RepID=A0AAD7FTG0_9AGAR|nr:hypothetical protein FB45DRAFT_902552 [Roridomyces roridus]